MSCAPYRIIRVEFVYPPIPDRTHDYSAVFDGYEPGEIIGWGRTEQEAINDLHDRLDEEIDFSDWLRTPQGMAYQQERRRHA